MKQDPNQQQKYTFGSSKAALRLYSEIKKEGLKYKAAVTILQKSEERLNNIVTAKSFPSKHYFIILLRRDTIDRIKNCGCDELIKGLCRNVFVTKTKQAIKAIQADY